MRGRYENSRRHRRHACGTICPGVRNPPDGCQAKQGKNEDAVAGADEPSSQDEAISQDKIASKYEAASQDEAASHYKVASQVMRSTCLTGSHCFMF